MSVHKLTSGTHSRWTGDKKTGEREEYDAHDTEKNLILDLSEKEKELLKGRIEEVKGGVEGKTSAVSADLASTTTSPSSFPSPGSYYTLLAKSIPEIEEEVSEIDDVEILDAIRQEEVAGKQRMGVLKVLKSRREEIEKE